ncbi:MAG: hypothetical protein MI742_01375 [Desulfobacterales bacterium]|nr:hypothetical protein [Desulfobacterales bacterium]
MKKMWGVLLLVMGVAMFVTIPSKARQIQEIRELSGGAVMMMKGCFYIISVLLIGGGLQKIRGKKSD